MTENRKISKLILLNCLTLGIYGAVAHQRMGNEINILCDGDGEQPRASYMVTILLSLIAPVLYFILSFVTSLVSANSINLMAMNNIRNVWGAVLGTVGTSIAIAPFWIAASIISVLFALYRHYWWYKQAARITLNANRFDLVVRERGTDILLFRTLLEIPLLIASAVLYCLHLLVPGILAWIFSLLSPAFGYVFFIICAFIFGIFQLDCSAGAYIGTYFMYKNLNRIAATGMNPQPFDSMAYEYYPSFRNNYNNAIPRINYGDFASSRGNSRTVPVQSVTPPPIPDAFLESLRGSSKGYKFNLPDGEVVVIGRDPDMANVVIDSAYDKVSGAHVSILFEKQFNKFRVVDQSTNGTYVDGIKLEPGKNYSFERGAHIELADGGNVFRLI